MKWKNALLLIVIAGLVDGCTGPRWQIKPSAYSWGDNSEHTDHNSLLLDARTGSTWILQSGEDGYYWEALTVKDEEGK